MKMATIGTGMTGAVLAAALAACAAPSSPSGPTAQSTADVGGKRAVDACYYFARAEGLNPMAVTSTDAAESGYVVKLRLEDLLGRRFTGSCRYAGDGKVGWSEPLPSTVQRR
jgi:hypothetical protein